MKSDIPKPLHELHGRPILECLINNVQKAGIKDIVLVLGHNADGVKKKFSTFNVVVQSGQLGSGDALKCTRNYFSRFSGDILVLYTDTPLIKAETIKELAAGHKKNRNECTLLTARVKDPGGYGRIVRNAAGQVTKIVEEKDTTLYEKMIDEINIGVYAFKKKDLFRYLNKIPLNKKKKEYYLTDIITILRQAGKKINCVSVKDMTECFGVNSRSELAQANDIMKKRVLQRFMDNGVTVVDPLTTFIDYDVCIGRDTIIHPNTIIERNVTIGKNCVIGPFAHLRPGTVLDSRVEVGNYVELVRTTVGERCKIKHMTYLGDAVLGKNINVGAGTITANYDGKKKHQTIIGNKAFIGVGCILIAPVKIGNNAVVGAGSVVTKRHNVPDRATVVGIPARIFTKR